MSLRKFKVVLIGPAAVGKTSLLMRYTDDSFASKYKMTIGVDFMTKTIEYKKDEIVKITIWDIGGQDRYKFLRASFFDKSNGALIVFDLSRGHTLKELQVWLSDLRTFAGESIPFIIIGNKSDLLPDIGEVMARAEAKAFAEKEKGYYMETSAKTGNNVNEAFVELTRRMIEIKS